MGLVLRRALAHARLTGEAPLSDDPDQYLAVDGEEVVGRVYPATPGEGPRQWLWFISLLNVRLPDGTPYRGRADTIRQAQDQFAESYERRIVPPIRE